MADATVVKSDIKGDLHHFNSLERNKKLLAVGALVVLFVISLIIGKTMSSNKSAVPVKTPPTADKMAVSPTQAEKLTTALALSSSSNTLSVGTEEPITVTISKLPVAAVDIVLHFDPEVLTVANVQNGNVFDRVFVNKVEEGTVSFSAAVLPQNADKLKMGDVFTFTVTPIKEISKTEITFDATGTITALNGENTLGKADGATYVIDK